MYFVLKFSQRFLESHTRPPAESHKPARYVPETVHQAQHACVRLTCIHPHGGNSHGGSLSLQQQHEFRSKTMPTEAVGNSKPCTTANMPAIPKQASTSL